MSVQLLNKNVTMTVIFLFFLLIQIAPNLSQEGGYIHQPTYDNDSEEIPDWVYQYRSAGIMSTIIITLNGLWMLHNAKRHTTKLSLYQKKVINRLSSTALIC